MAEIASAFVTIAPSTRGFGSSLNRQVSGETRSAGTAVGRTFGKMFVLGAGVIAAAGIGNLLKGSIDEAREAQKVGAATEQIIKSTGGAANLTAKQIGNLSSRLSEKIGVDDELIASGANLLLTFKNVRNEAGKGGNIFTRATKAGADLAATGFGSITANAKMLGKALNDPTKGITALTRAGVTFTAKQIERIKGFVEEGKQLRAQKVLLREVESQVGGVAEATATSGAKAGVALGNLKEQIGTAFLPIIDRVAGVFATKIAPAISTFITGLTTGRGEAGRFGAVVRENLTRAIEAGREAFARVRKTIADNETELRQIGNVILTKVIPAVASLTSKHMKTFGQVLSFTISTIAFTVRSLNAAKGALDRVAAGARSANEAFHNFVDRAVERLARLIVRVRAMPGEVKAAVGNLRRLLYPAGQAIIDGLIDGVTSKINSLRDKLSGITKMIPDVKGPPSKDKTLLYGAGSLIMQGLIDGISSKEAALTKKLREQSKKIRESLSGLRGDLRGLIDPIASAFTGGLFDAENRGDFLKNLLGTKGQLQGLKAAFKKLLGWGLKPAFLSQFFASGNGGLILDLAAGTKGEAAQANALFGDIGSLSQSLGTSVVGATADGQRLIKGIDRLEAKLERIAKNTQDGPERTGRVINSAARGGMRKSWAA